MSEHSSNYQTALAMTRDSARHARRIDQATVHALLAIADAIQAPQSVDISQDRVLLEDGMRLDRGAASIEYRDETGIWLVWHPQPDADWETEMQFADSADDLAEIGRFLLDAAYSLAEYQQQAGDLQ